MHSGDINPYVRQELSIVSYSKTLASLLQVLGVCDIYRLR